MLLWPGEIQPREADKVLKIPDLENWKKGVKDFVVPVGRKAAMFIIGANGSGKSRFCQFILKEAKCQGEVVHDMGPMLWAPHAFIEPKEHVFGKRGDTSQEGSVA